MGRIGSVIRTGGSFSPDLRVIVSSWFNDLCIGSPDLPLNVDAPLNQKSLFSKRVFDTVLVFVSCPVWIPLFLIIAVLVRWKLGSPVIFRQSRPGLNGQIFELFKFRTMTDARDARGALLPDADRLTSFGRWLRSTSLDELPELINVLKGEMSLVGPRPLLVQYLNRYTPEQARRHEVRPGLTGWAQVNGRNAISWEEKFRLDVWYVDHQSTWLDLGILSKTVKSAFLREGISASGEATMPEFMGELGNSQRGHNVRL
jgi:lipopolysaccharide/colanic/teichoic acid biosynthesis glycosyltransferase